MTLRNFKARVLIDIIKWKNVKKKKGNSKIIKNSLKKKKKGKRSIVKKNGKEIKYKPFKG